jgi:phosphoglucomutase
MKVNPLAVKPAPPAMRANIPKLVTVCYSNMADTSVPGQRVAFGTSGHRGSSFEKTFNEWHVLAICQAICHYRKQQGSDGPLFLGIDTQGQDMPEIQNWKWSNPK